MLNNFSKDFSHFKKMVNSLRQVLHSEISIFCLMLYKDFQKQSVGHALEVLAKSSGTVVDEVHFIVI